MDIGAIQKAIPTASTHLSASRLTDVEFIYSPSQIALAALRLTNRGVVDDFLQWQYTNTDDEEPAFGMSKERLLQVLETLEGLIMSGEGEMNLKKVKEVDKRLRQCSNPAKIPGTAL